MENLLARKVFPYDPTDVIAEFGTDLVKDKCDRIFKQMDDFVEKTKGRMIPIKSELVVGDMDYQVCGMIDQLFYNKKTGMLEIWDWKTNGDLSIAPYIKRDGTFDCLLGEFGYIPKTKLDVYSLQLNMYKHIIEKNTDLKIGDCHLAWFMEDNDSVKTFKCKDYSDAARKMLSAT